MFRRSKWMKFIGLPILGMFVLCGYQVNAQTTSFSYQGRLQDGGTPASGNYDLQFTLWDNSSGGTQQPVASPVTVIKSGVAVSAGIFTVQLDFGVSALPGADRFLEIGVRPAGGASFTLLSPRQQITATPYAIRTLSATTADGLSSACVGCVQDSQINGVAGTKVTGAIPVAGVPAGSGKYIQNSISPQLGTNFNIDGTGTVGSAFSAAQYNIGNKRVLGVGGSNSNTFTGIDAGAVTTGSGNSFFGFQAGNSNSSGLDNSFFGDGSGFSSTGSRNSFFGSAAGLNNSSGSSNSFFGVNVGIQNSDGIGNSFFGERSGFSNTGSNNSFFGRDAGSGNETGSLNTAVGFDAGVGTGTLTNATAIGAQAVVNQSDSLVLGRIKDVNNNTAGTSVGIGTSAPAAILNVVGPAGDANADAIPVLKIIGGKGGSGSGLSDGKSGAQIVIQAGDGGNSIAAAGGKGGSIILAPGTGGTGNLGPGSSGNVGIGTTQPNTTLDVAGKVFVRGAGTLANNLGAADLQVGYGLASFGTAGQVARLALQPYGHTGGPWIFRARDDATKAYLDWVYGSATTGITQDGGGNVGIGEGAPTFKLHVTNPAANGLRVVTNTAGGTLASFGGFGVFQIDANGIPAGRFVVQENGKVGIGTPAPDNTLTVNGGADKPGGGSWGTFSDERLKNIRGRFTPGLNAVMRLQPLRYEYKPDNALGIKSEGEHIGFSAQQVQQIIPEAVSRNDKGYLLVNNDPILWTMLNAIKEQQAQIERQQKQIDQLKRVACHAHAKSRACR